MATISYDGQSFLIDGRRIWLVSGSIHYVRTPHQLWRRRIRAAKEAGLNCIETYVFWNVHEPSPGAFHFEGDADLRKFVQIIAEEGLYCILRPGPYICAEWDFGGLPAWLHRIPGIRLREGNGPFLEACARYLGAVIEQVKDLQINENGLRGPTNAVADNAGGTLVIASGSTPAGASGSAPRGRGGTKGKRGSASKGASAPALSQGGAAGNTGMAALPPAPGAGSGPIIMIQAENEWFCRNPAQEDSYLREIVRYLRESGVTVPINACNNLWQHTDGVIDTWNANQHLAFDLRQLHVVQPNAPRLVTEFWPGWFDTWGRPHHTSFDAGWTSYRLAQILAVGAQYNLYMFHGGTNFGFYGGRTLPTPDSFITTSYDYDAPLHEAGGRGPKYAAVKRISTFASQFGQLFANLDPGAAPAVAAPNDEDHPLCVIHQTGSQGEVVFLLKSQNDKTTDARIMLPNGLNLPVPLGADRVAWFVLRANLGGVAELTYTNLRPWAWVARKMLVLFGPAGAQGLIAINDAPLTVTVPDAHTPLVVRHEDFTVVVLSGEQVDTAYLTPTGLAVGCAALDDGDQPVPMDDGRAITLIDLDGQTRRLTRHTPKRPSSPRLGKWQRAPLGEWINGTAEEFRAIEGPGSLEAQHCDLGYGWYRLHFPKGRPAHADHALAPEAGDRLHIYSDGRPEALWGLGPGAQEGPAPLKLGKTTVVLADNMGRFNYGWSVGESKGLWGHIHDVKPVRLAAPRIVAEKAPDPFTWRGFVLHQRAGDRPPASAAIWQVTARQNPLILDIRDLPGRAMVLVNGLPVGLYDQWLSVGAARFVLRPKQELKGGRNEIRLAFFHELGKEVDPAKFVRLYEATENLTAGAEWSFAPWSIPEAKAFTAAGTSRAATGPAWYRCAFTTPNTDQALWLEPAGMSKGQIILNGHNAGRYFVATAGGKAVPPQSKYYLPEPWLRTDGPNELMLFDEHDKSPARCRLVYDVDGPYGS